MLVRKHSKNYNFLGNTITGTTFRWGTSFSNDPISAPWPELADISISNHCSKMCSFCYRNSTPNGSFISLNDYEFILNQLTDKRWGSVFQIAIGGGEPTEHPNFIEIIKLTRKKGIIPNYTTNGEVVSSEIIKSTAKYCGAVAISVTPKELKVNKIKQKLLKQFIQEDVKVNLHFILASYSVHEAIKILEGKYDTVLQSVNSVIFLTYKPFGRASARGVLKFSNDLRKFLLLVDKPKTQINFGFDACFVPMLMKYTKIDNRFIDSCECGFFSVYIDELLNVKPCSFSNNSDVSFNLKQFSFKEIWQKKFSDYRKQLYKTRQKQCLKCRAKNCRGGCPFFSEINLCQLMT